MSGVIRAVSGRQNSLTKPPGALGRLLVMAIFMAGWQGTVRSVIGAAPTTPSNALFSARLRLTTAAISFTEACS
ncbi:nicotinate-nucleotide--dimethylbenzimidazole phosphoribosyltransferase [Tropicibacter sp. S64]|uniref:nicotinate-nucleotide--dimethylbenzimidazole phosphoribosyltransferase n=1 Tax=Tropicibacter sp. S64 TaxID=3415122 RepID=UPI003C7B7BD2